MGYVSKYRGVDIDQAIEFAKEHADINDKLSKKAEALHTHSLSDITGLTDLKVSWDNITGKPEVFPCDGSCGGSSDNSGNNSGEGGVVSGTIAWGNITGKPATFAPSAHTHVITDLSNIGDLKVDWNNIVNKPENIGTGTGSTITLTWENIQNKPDAFSPTRHRHDVSDIDGLESGSGGPVEWEDVLNKPDLASRIHKHSITDINGLEDRLNYIEQNAGSGNSGGNTGGSGGYYDSELKNKVQIIENDVDNLQSQVEIVQSGFVEITRNYKIIEQYGTLTVKAPDTNGPGDGDGNNDGVAPPSGDLKNGDNFADELVCLEVYSETSGSAYLRYASYSNYEGAEWAPGEEYNLLLDDTYSYNYLFSIAQ